MGEEVEQEGRRMTELKPCPFCGGTSATIKPVWKTYYFVACHRCKAGGPVMKTEAEAADEWNRRAEDDSTD